MMKKEDIRGLVVLIPILLLVLLVVLLAKPNGDSIGRRKGAAAQRTVADSLFEFDPNTAELRELLALGVPRTAIGAIFRRRAADFPFTAKEELIGLYGMTDSIYFRLEPYIVIDGKFKPEPRTVRTSERRSYAKPEIRYETFRIDTATAAYLSTIGFSRRQAEVIVDYRDRCGGFYSLEEFARCYVVDREICDTLARYIIFPEPAERAVSGPIEINTADSATLRSVFGIGEKSVSEILDYRQRLGGFYDLNQLAELKSVTESNFEKILTQIYCDSCNISKIDINFATRSQLEVHPYFARLAPRKLRKLFSKRQLKGGWSRIEEMIEDDIFDQKEAERLRPYLRFTQSTGHDSGR